MKLMTPTVSRPVIGIIVLALIVLLHLALLIVTWYVLAHQAKHAAEMASLASKDIYKDLLSNIKDDGRSLLSINQSAFSLARVLNSSVSGSSLSFSTIENQVAHDLFLEFSTHMHLSQISYILENGLFFSYYKEENHTFVLFANMTYDSVSPAQNSTIFYRWYRQPVNDDTGMRFGEVIETSPIILDNSSFYNALDSKNGYSSWGLGWGETQEPLFLFMFPVKENLPRGQRGVVSLGIPIKVFANLLSNKDLHSADLFLATEDGHVLAQTGPPNTNMEFKNGTLIVKLTNLKDKVAVTSILYKLKCSNTDSNLLIASNVNILGTRYNFYCASLEIAGLRSVAVLIISKNGLESFIHKQCRIAIALLISMFALVFPTSCYFICLLMRATKKEMLLSAALIKQMEATQQAERKSMNKSIAFASASHDVRTSLAAITGLIDLCLSSVYSQLEMQTNLEQMRSCASNLLGILNSVLDTSKIEAGKMQLEEQEFNLVQVLEEAVDIFHVVGSKKGLQVMLDPCDGSVLKYFHVIGDCGRLKQILHNLLSNAVKFTSEGHVVLRAWVKKPNSENSILSSNHGGCFHKLCAWSQFIFKAGDAYNDLGSIHTVQQGSSSIEFIVEVDDTGKGIPKEKRKAVFENFVQVKESNSGGHEGTGLGLGIVQSLVRLMGGEIMITDKEYGERGTCFKFNIFLHARETNDSDAIEEDIKLHKDEISTSVKGMKLRKGLNLEGLNVILLVQDKEGGLILQRWMECHGVKVWPINQWDHLYPTFEKLKHKMFFNQSSPSGNFDSTSLQSYSGNSISYHFNEEDKYDYSLSSNITGRDLYKRTSHKSELNFVLIIIDMSCGYFLETCSTLARFSKNTHDLLYKVVWLVDPNTPRNDLESLENKQAPCDLILQKPLHGSRLSAVIKLLREYGDTVEGQPNERKMGNIMQGAHDSIKLSPMKLDHVAFDSTASQSSYLTQQIIRLEGNLSSDKPLSGMNILVAEDNVVLRRLAITTLSRLGATVEYCENGEDALNLVRKALQGTSGMHNGSQFNQGTSGPCKRFSYDIVLMDCEMPIMNGYEATKRIRMEERQYGLRIPIIALTAHAMAEEVNKSIQAGMDFHLTKPLTTTGLLEAIHSVYQVN